MGSLVGGWDSPKSDPRTVKLQRNKSMTNERIEDFWRLKRKAEEEHLEAILHKNSISVPELVVVVPVDQPQRSTSLPEELEVTSAESGDINKKLQGDQVVRKSGWWRRSNSAFLNEPPPAPCSD